MIEVEVKIQISDPKSLRDKLKHLEGIYKLSLIHEDIYYNMPTGLRDFAKTDEALRIRSSKEYKKGEKPKTEKEICYLTYKGKKLDQISKSRHEIELRLENANYMKEILANLGFREIITVKKERELYEFEHMGNKIEALIDYLPVLNSYFLEVELTAQSNEELSEKRDQLFHFLTELGYTQKDSITESYLELIIKKFRS